MPGAGHLVHDEAPQMYRQAVESFLLDLARSALFAGQREPAIERLRDQSIGKQ